MKALKLMAFAGLALAACESIELKEAVNPTENEARPVTFTVGALETRVGLSGEIKEGSFGFIPWGEPQQEIRYENEKWNVIGEPIMFREGSEILYFAYYPYEEGFVNTHTSIIPAEQTEENIKATEFLYASNVVNTEYVNIEFSHAHAMLRIQLEGLTSDMAVESVTICGGVVEAEFTSNIRWEISETDPIKGDVKMYKHSDSEFEALCIPYYIDPAVIKISVTENGENVTYSASTQLPLTRGRRLTVPVTLTKTKADGPVAVAGQMVEENW